MVLVLLGTTANRDMSDGIDERANARTKPMRKTQGARTIKEKAAEMGRGGGLWSGRKVCLISGRGWKVASRGCSGAGWDFGRIKSKRLTDMGSYFAVPMMRVTFSGLLLGVGGRESGGRLRFCDRY